MLLRRRLHPSFLIIANLEQDLVFLQLIDMLELSDHDIGEFMHLLVRSVPGFLQDFLECGLIVDLGLLCLFNSL